LEKYARENGGENISFQIIIASGKNSSVPHHQTSDKIIKKGDMLIIDFGAVVGGYRSDLTRTVFLGKPNERQKKIYQAVLKTQDEIIKKVKPGLTGYELDQQTRNNFDKMGFGSKFLHGLGHGIGLEIHELPFLNKYSLGSELKLKANMVFTIEPGLYFTGWGGVRIEDVVLVTSTSCQVLSNAPKELGEMIISA
jgi:Xaa-Pro aminopeptidase